MFTVRRLFLFLGIIFLTGSLTCLVQGCRLIGISDDGDDSGVPVTGPAVTTLISEPVKDMSLAGDIDLPEEIMASLTTLLLWAQTGNQSGEQGDLTKMPTAEFKAEAAQILQTLASLASPSDPSAATVRVRLPDTFTGEIPTSADSLSHDPVIGLYNVVNALGASYSANLVTQYETMLTGIKKTGVPYEVNVSSSMLFPQVASDSEVLVRVSADLQGGTPESVHPAILGGFGTGFTNYSVKLQDNKTIYSSTVQVAQPAATNTANLRLRLPQKAPPPKPALGICRVFLSYTDGTKNPVKDNETVHDAGPREYFELIFTSDQRTGWNNKYGSLFTGLVLGETVEFYAYYYPKTFIISPQVIYLGKVTMPQKFSSDFAVKFYVTTSGKSLSNYKIWSEGTEIPQQDNLDVKVPLFIPVKTNVAGVQTVFRAVVPLDDGSSMTVVLPKPSANGVTYYSHPKVALPKKGGKIYISATIYGGGAWNAIEQGIPIDSGIPILAKADQEFTLLPKYGPSDPKYFLYTSQSATPGIVPITSPAKGQQGFNATTITLTYPGPVFRGGVKFSLAQEGTGKSIVIDPTPESLAGGLLLDPSFVSPVKYRGGQSMGYVSEFSFGVNLGAPGTWTMTIPRGAFSGGMVTTVKFNTIPRTDPQPPEMSVQVRYSKDGAREETLETFQPQTLGESKYKDGFSFRVMVWPKGIPEDYLGSSPKYLIEYSVDGKNWTVIPATKETPYSFFWRKVGQSLIQLRTRDVSNNRVTSLARPLDLYVYDKDPLWMQPNVTLDGISTATTYVQISQIPFTVKNPDLANVIAKVYWGVPKNNGLEKFAVPASMSFEQFQGEVSSITIRPANSSVDEATLWADPVAVKMILAFGPRGREIYTREYFFYVVGNDPAKNGVPIASFFRLYNQKTGQDINADSVLYDKNSLHFGIFQKYPDNIGPVTVSTDNGQTWTSPASLSSLVQTLPGNTWEYGYAAEGTFNHLIRVRDTMGRELKRSLTLVVDRTSPPAPTLNVASGGTIASGTFAVTAGEPGGKILWSPLSDDNAYYRIYDPKVKFSGTMNLGFIQRDDTGNVSSATVVTNVTFTP